MEGEADATAIKEAELLKIKLVAVRESKFKDPPESWRRDAESESDVSVDEVI